MRSLCASLAKLSGVCIACDILREGQGEDPKIEGFIPASITTGFDAEEYITKVELIPTSESKEVSMAEATVSVNEYKDFNNNAIMTSDGAGVVTPNAAGIKNVPAFEAYLSNLQAATDNTDTKVTFDTEVFDTDNAYDGAGKFTPQTAGKYCCYANVYGGNDGNSSLNYIHLKFWKNGKVLIKM